MPEPNSLQQLVQQYQAQAQSEKHLALMEALRNYETQTANFRQTRRRRKLPLVTAQDKGRLMELHKAIGNAAEEILKDKGESQALKDIVKKITVLSSGSYRALRLGRQGAEIKPMEQQTAQENLRQAQAAQQRRREEREPQLIQPAPGSGPF